MFKTEKQRKQRRFLTNTENRKGVLENKFGKSSVLVKKKKKKIQR